MRTLDDNESESRDILGEMVIAALVMITGGEEKEEARIRRADRMLVMGAIIDAGYYVRAKSSDKNKQLIAADIVEGFERLAEQLDPVRDSDKIKRARESNASNHSHPNSVNYSYPPKKKKANIPKEFC